MPISKVLVVDDSPADLVNIKSIVSETGCLTVSATSGKEALEKARSEKPDLIFLDIIMPDMDGYEACRLLTHDSVTKDIPIVFVTSKTQKADRMWAQMQGGKGFISKPYLPDQIVDQLKAFR